MVSGLATYAFLALTARGLGPQGYASFAVGWAAALVVTIGVFAPLEQEAARRVSTARSQGRSAAPDLRAVAAVAVLLAVGTAAALVVLGVLARLVVAVPGAGLPRGAVLDLLSPGSPAWWALLAVGIACAVQLPVRGALSGSGRLTSYGAVVAVEALVRVGLAALLVLVGLRSPAAFLALVAVSAVVSVSAGLVGVRRSRSRGAVAAAPGDGGAESLRRGGISVARAVGALIVGALAAQILLNAGPVLVEALATDSERADAGRLSAGMSLARVPLFLFTAVQAALIPALATAVAGGDVTSFRSTVVRLLAWIGAVTGVAAVGALFLGRTATGLLFGDDFELAGTHLAVLVTGVGCYLLALSAAAALVSLGRHGAVVRGWAVGLVATAVVTAAVQPLFERVEWGFLAGSLAAAGWLGIEIRKTLVRCRR